LHTMEILRIILLLTAVAGVVLPKPIYRRFLIPLICATLSILIGSTTTSVAKSAFETLESPIAFLLAVVPLAVLLDRLGFFRAAAHLGSKGRFICQALWIIAAVTTAVLNLDASVVLLTPLYIELAKLHNADSFKFCVIPLILAYLASSALPVSNLTNLILVSKLHISLFQFEKHMLAPTVVAVVAGWFFYSIHFRPRLIPKEVPKVDLKKLLVGGAIVIFTLVGFVIGPNFGIAHWQVAVASDVILIALTRNVPLGSIPWQTGLLAMSLGILTQSALSSFKLGFIKSATSLYQEILSSFGLGAAANLFNNLPTTLLVSSAYKNNFSSNIWFEILGLNIAPSLLITGSLAALLWLEIVNKNSVKVSPVEFAKINFKIVIPSYLLSLVCVSITSRIV
jgi:arsenical pump membrane protein